MRNKIILMLASVLVAGSLFGCSEAEKPGKVRVGVLPDQSAEILKSRYGMLMERLTKTVGIEFELVIPASYAELLKMFSEGKIEMAYFGGFTFVKANQQFGAVPLVMRDVDTKFTSYFLSKPIYKTKSLGAFKGKKIGFGSKLSTSGHLMPRFFLKKQGAVPEKFFNEVVYSGKHDRTAYWVRDGKIDLGAANRVVIDRLFAEGKLNRNEVIVWTESPPYPDYVWAIQAGVSEEYREKIRTAFLDLSDSDSEPAKILKSLGTKAFLPARLADFEKLIEIAKQTGLL